MAVFDSRLLRLFDQAATDDHGQCDAINRELFGRFVCTLSPSRHGEAVIHLMQLTVKSVRVDELARGERLHVCSVLQSTGPA